MVNMGENTRIVSFSPSSASPASDPPGGDVELLLQAIRASFKDILQPGQTFFLQLKSEEWGGAFVDMLGSDNVADRSVVRAVLKPPSSEVSEIDYYSFSFLIFPCFGRYPQHYHRVLQPHKLGQPRMESRYVTKYM